MSTDSARIRASDYHDIAKPSDPRLSPDGERVAFVRSVPDGDDEYESTVYVAPTDGSAAPRRLTLAEGSDAEPRFSPSGDRLAFTSTRGKADDTQQLWVLPLDGGEAERVTNVVGGVSAIAWSPDGSRVAFVQSVSDADREANRDRVVPDGYEPDDPDPRVIDRTVYRSAQRYFDGARPQVYVVDVAAATGDGGTGGTDADEEDDAGLTRVTTADYDHAAPTWGDASTLYYTARQVGDDPDDDMRYDIVAYDTESGDSETVHRSSGWGTTLAVTADDRVAYSFTEAEQASIKPTELRVYDRAADETHDVTAEMDRTLGYGARPQWGPDEETLYFATPDEGATALWAAPGDASAAPERAYRGGDVTGADVGESATALAKSEWDHPGEVYVLAHGRDGDGPAVGADGSEERRLSDLNADLLDSVELREPEELEFESEQGSVEGWVLTPPGFGESDARSASTERTESAESEQYPLVAEVHGGPHAMWTASGSMWHEFQTLAARGYVVFWSNPRGSTGYGAEYAAAIERDWGDVTLTDVLAGVEAVADREYVDESNVFLTGGSFGGYMTSWTVGQTDYFRAAVSQRGVYDMTGFYGSTDGAYKLVEGDYDTTPSEEPAFLWEQSPVAHADGVETPTLVLHSDDDYRTPANTAELFHRILRKNRVDTRLVRYPREGHELSRSGEPAHVVDRIERIARWFDGYSDHHDAGRALDRPENDGLSAGEEEGDDDENGDDDEGTDLTADPADDETDPEVR
ncbi:S9 family peptidase [Candidatus Halobonum tyrrellensis]|uniref:Dipeptidyl aminopeptidase/acylaminoacyl peptidase n=1 Tax=Candidatus Halobonum tyrrellensis G22 TaxID=1324957 RepID=V4J2A9_9EURY|nr:S9 family peptidase [Candidatus Halobonum tyrrellensis]ESP89547.1 dipeptidyl aminopeptidase/acylaminoacyl peptidase [Candidatus Halobonum tyrrellensis G22]